MNFSGIVSNVTMHAADFSVETAWSNLQPFLIFTVGMLIYALFIFKFYRFIARREVFKKRIRDWDKHKGTKKFMLALEYIFLFPIVAFMWFIGFTAIMSVIAKVIAINDIFMISMAVLTTIRITAYYDEELSRDVAKLLPFALLGIFLLDISGVSYGMFFRMLVILPEMTGTLFYYFVFIVVLELFLRFTLFLRGGGDYNIKTEEDES